MPPSHGAHVVMRSGVGLKSENRNIVSNLKGRRDFRQTICGGARIHP
jgi:hypothetical protein